MITAVLIVALALAAALIPGSALELQRGGAYWRFVTCHFTHFTFEQLAWDAAVLLFLGIACARRNCRAFHATLLASLFLIPAAVLLFAPDVQTYRGLSGIDSALFALLLTLEWRRSLAVALFAVGFVAKTVAEMFTATAVFAGSNAFAPVPVAHLAGAVIGLIIGIWLRDTLNFVRTISQRESRIRKALQTVRNRSRRSCSAVRELLAKAKVRSESGSNPKIIVTFTAPPFRGGLHQVYDPAHIDGASDRELANILSWSLRDSVARKIGR